MKCCDCENGKKYIEQEYKDGKRHGLMFSWYDNGSKKEQIYYTMDIINGAHLQWYENGQKKEEGTLTFYFLLHILLTGWIGHCSVL